MQTATQPAYEFTLSDMYYRDAVNYNGQKYYNFPITFSIGGKKYITPFGSLDTKSVQVEGHYIYIVGENSLLGYIGMLYIDTITDTTGDCYFSDNDLREFGDIFEMPTSEQVALLSNYLPY